MGTVGTPARTYENRKKNPKNSMSESVAHVAHPLPVCPDSVCLCVCVCVHYQQSLCAKHQISKGNVLIEERTPDMLQNNNLAVIFILRVSTCLPNLSHDPADFFEWMSGSHILLHFSQIKGF